VDYPILKIGYLYQATSVLLKHQCVIELEHLGELAVVGKVLYHNEEDNDVISSLHHTLVCRTYVLQAV